MTKIQNNCRTCQKRKICRFGNGMAITWTHCGQWLPGGNSAEAIITPEPKKEIPINLFNTPKCVICGNYIKAGSKRRLYCSNACYREAMRRKELLRIKKK